ncbi:unnamed protein product [Rotaria sordida]|uniref:RanBP2-type domain-containing protein n=1 Tax=Rotaria sordida TaxID=392033 RepID=A0A814IJR8_9BILA|nr:unnamed protein product [Rotaria sordida]
MSKYDANALDAKHTESNTDAETKPSSPRNEENDDSLSSLASSKHKSPNDTSYTDDSSLSASKKKNTAAKSANDEEDTYYNRIPEDSRRETKTSKDLSDQQDPITTLSSTEVQDWKCRECGFTNKDSDTACDACETHKPMHPRLEIRPSHSERRMSASPSDRRSSSPEDESMYSRADSRSSSRARRRSSSREQSPSKKDLSDNERSYPYSSIVGSRSRRKSSDSCSSDDNRYQSSENNTKQRQTSEHYVSSTTSHKQELAYPRGGSGEEKSSVQSVAAYSSSSKNKNTEQDARQTKTSNKDVFSKGSSKRSPSRSPSPSDDKKGSYSSSYEGSRHQSTGTTAKQMKSPTSSSSSRKSNQDDPIIVYVPDLPVNIENNQLLENIIRQCLELKHKQKVLDVKCDTELGIGIVYLYNDEDKNNLINIIGKIIVELSNNTTVSFVDELELISYIVIDGKDMKDLPSVDEICRRWVHLYKMQSQPRCELLSVQFPNIFRIVTHSLNELLTAMSIREFSINNRFATVYFRADCAFFEDLPRTTNLDRLKLAIDSQISNKYMSKELIHIQYNKEDANAVVLTSGRARIWALYSSILLDGRVIMKKDSLACRVLIRSVPKGVSASLIQDHKIFANAVVKTLPSDEHVILELSDKNIYEKCIDQGALRIGDHVLGIEAYTFSSNPEDSEINAENWYETEMCDHKPDIMPFIANLQHHIFRFKWNSNAFLEQFRRWTSNTRKIDGKDQDKYEKLCNLKRHLLRMTVMLNTIGVVKRGFYRIGEKEIKLKSDRVKTILYDHKSKLQRGKTTSLSQATEFPHASTSVKVVNEDCLIVYKNLVSKGCRPVLLNMANANSPGGGYKRGDGAQEETIFRRSNYFQSLDLELDNGKPTNRFYCNANCELEPLAECDALYPIDEFGAIYTSGLTVFRQPEDTGYAFMEIPMYDVCAIAMAAYRDPKIQNDLLTSKYSIGTRKKIENIFAIAHHQKHDSLVLSALGCGAFRNPPKHIAAIFKSVIEQYAGYFKYIYFAIIDDHNTGQDLNPIGNFRPFQNSLDNLDAEPKRHKLVDMMIGPWRILNQTTMKEITLSDIRICYLNPCIYGAKCNDLKNEQHSREYSHPPLCPYADNTTPCKQKNDSQHTLWFRHRQRCSYGGECELIENDLMHSNEFEHPEFCRDSGRCENMDNEHLKAYRHVPLCKYRRQCVDYNRGSKDHCLKFRHCIPMCRFGHFCVRFHDEKHSSEENHPFQPACPFTPFHCRQYNSLCETKNIKTLPIDVQNHCLKYSHVCRYGRQCQETSDTHWKTTIHIARNICSFDDKCTRLNQEDHLNSFSHPGIADIRRLCSYQAYECRDRRKSEHIIKYRHHGNHDYSGVIGCFGQNKKSNFVENQRKIVQEINDYAKGLNSKHQLSIPSEIQKWIKGLQPIHRCSKVIFESILVHGHVMSRDHMEHLKKSSFAAQTVQEHKRVRAIFDRYKMSAIEDHAKEYIRAIVSLEYSKKYGAVAAAEAGTGGSSVSTGSDDYNDTIRKKERILQTLIKPEEVDTIKRCAIDIAEASWNLHNAPTGIKYEPDKLLRTDKHVFSILGPHLGHYYGDIILVFKSEVMLHPDANFSPQAATSFSSKRTFSHRPWVKDPGTQVERIKCFHESKLHCAIPGYEYAAAAELMAVSGLRKKTMDVDLKGIIHRWKEVDSHEVFEAHLPQLVPLDYIDEIYIPKNLFNSLTSAAQQSAKKIFRDALHITKHEINLTSTGGGGPHPSDRSRSDYQDFVTSALIQKFEKRKERTRRFRGFVLTLEPSQFTDHIVLPLTINEARNQYLRTHKQSSNSDDTYIYWEAMYGDMMITLSDEPINPDKSQPRIQCLVCYIAERPSTTTTNYNESYSYLNADEPYRHIVIKANGQCSSSSRSFHRGCNIENFLTYCLKIEKKTGQVTLSHAGPNSIYCYETITYKFSKAIIDLGKLEYVHVSAGSHKVPIRNLIISFEQIPDLYPSFDKNFKRGDDAFSRRKRSHSRDHLHSLKTPQSPEDKSPSFLNKAKDAVLGLFGYDDKKLEPCPHSINCLLQKSSKHMREYSHPCPYSELCSNKDKEPNLTHEPRKVEQCSLKSSCQKLDDPVHRAMYRHPGYPDFLIPCPDGLNCRNKTSDHQTKYSHGQPVETARDKIHDTPHKASSKPHTEYEEKKSPHEGRNDQRTVCRYGSNCRDQNDSHHYSKYSHPREHGSKPSASSSHERISCRHGRDCRDKKDPQHCSKYSHPDEHKSSSSARSNRERTACRYGRDCREKNDPQHCSKYSHPGDQRSRDHESSNYDKIQCKFGDKCYDTDPNHRSKYSHPNKK